MSHTQNELFITLVVLSTFTQIHYLHWQKKCGNIKTLLDFFVH